MNLQEAKNRLENRFAPRKKEMLFLAILFLTASLSFGLGYLANRELSKPPIIIEKCSE
ncbi:MAG: hypothetical protein UY99_C0036G0003 [Parcubacteria group bacterium GW2011_GWA1_59_11]|nr:MAG: hypothetical protein UY99_C0036G0003 [Parcubacteria group bacterium GW2011_GWA1_59_11]